MPSAFRLIDKFSELADVGILTSGQPIAWSGTEVVTADLSGFAQLSGATFTGNVNFGNNALTLNGSAITSWVSAVGSSGTIQLTDGNGNFVTGSNPLTINLTTGTLSTKNVNFGNNTLTLNGSAITSWVSAVGSSGTIQLTDGSGHLVAGSSPLTIDLTSGELLTRNVNFGTHTLTLNGSSITSWPTGGSSDAVGSAGTVQLSDGNSNFVAGNTPLTVDLTSGNLSTNGGATFGADITIQTTADEDKPFLNLYNGGAGGKNFSIGSTNEDSCEGAGFLSIFNVTDGGWPMLLDGFGNVTFSGTGYFNNTVVLNNGGTLGNNLDTNNQNILNVQEITSYSGLWTLNNDGALTVRSIYSYDDYWAYGTSGLFFADNKQILWSSGSSWDSTPWDLTLERSNASQLTIGDGSEGLGNLIVKTITNSIDGLILQGTGSNYGRINVSGDDSAWIDNHQSAYFQISTGSNNFATFSGNNAVLDRLQFCSSFTQITDGVFTETPVPTANLGIINSNNKIGFSILAANNQTDSFVELNAHGPTNVVKIDIDGTYQIADSTGIAFLKKATSALFIGNEDNTGDIIYEDGDEIDLGIDINPSYLDTEDDEGIETESGIDLTLDSIPIDGFEILSETITPYNDGYGVIHINSIVLHGNHSTIFGGNGWLQWNPDFAGFYDNTGLLTSFDGQGVHTTGSYYGDGSHLTGISGGSPEGSNGDLQFKNNSDFAGGGPNWSGSLLNIPGNMSFSSGSDIRFNGTTDENWRIGILNAFSTTTIGRATSLQLVVGQGEEGPDGFAVGQCDDGTSIFEVDGPSKTVYFDGNIIDDGGNISITPNFRCLDDENNTVSINWESSSRSGSILKTGGNTVLDWGNQLLKNPSGTTLLDWAGTNANIKLQQITSSLPNITVSCGFLMQGNDISMNDGSGSGGGNLLLDQGLIIDNGSTLYSEGNFTANSFFITPSKIGNLQAGFIGDYETGSSPTLDIGINPNQFGSRDQDFIGSIFRLDSRADLPFFSLRYQPSGGSAEFTPLQITPTGNVLIGTGWGADNTTGSSNNEDLQVYADIYLGEKLNLPTGGYIENDDDGGVNFVDFGGNILNWNQWDNNGLDLNGALLCMNSGATTGGGEVYLDSALVRFGTGVTMQDAMGSVNITGGSFNLVGTSFGNHNQLLTFYQFETSLYGYDFVLDGTNGQLLLNGVNDGTEFPIVTFDRTTLNTQFGSIPTGANISVFDGNSSTDGFIYAKALSLKYPYSIKIFSNGAVPDCGGIYFQNGHSGNAPHYTNGVFTIGLSGTAWTITGPGTWIGFGNLSGLAFDPVPGESTTGHPSSNLFDLNNRSSLYGASLFFDAFSSILGDGAGNLSLDAFTTTINNPLTVNAQRLTGNAPVGDSVQMTDPYTVGVASSSASESAGSGGYSENGILYNYQIYNYFNDGNTTWYSPVVGNASFTDANTPAVAASGAIVINNAYVAGSTSSGTLTFSGVPSEGDMLNFSSFPNVFYFTATGSSPGVIIDITSGDEETILENTVTAINTTYGSQFCTATNAGGSVIDLTGFSASPAFNTNISISSSVITTTNLTGGSTPSGIQPGATITISDGAHAAFTATAVIGTTQITGSFTGNFDISSGSTSTTASNIATLIGADGQNLSFSVRGATINLLNEIAGSDFNSPLETSDPTNIGLTGMSGGLNTPSFHVSITWTATSSGGNYSGTLIGRQLNGGSAEFYDTGNIGVSGSFTDTGNLSWIGFPDWSPSPDFISNNTTYDYQVYGLYGNAPYLLVVGDSPQFTDDNSGNPFQIALINANAFPVRFIATSQNIYYEQIDSNSNSTQANSSYTGNSIGEITPTYSVNFTPPAANFNGNVVISHDLTTGQISQTVQSLSDGGDDGTIQWLVVDGPMAELTLAGSNETLSIINAKPGARYMLEITQGSGGNFTITTWTNVKWSNGTVPTLSTDSGAIDIIEFTTWDGVNFYGFFQNSFS